MKRLALKSTLIAVLAVFIFGGVATAARQPYRSDTNIVVPASEVVDHSLFVTGTTVTIAGTVNGDVFCAGQTVFITGTVNGDVFCAGQEVRISGTINGSVRSAGQSVSVAGAVQRAISLAGQTVSVEPNAKIGSDASLAGASVLVAGEVARDAYAAGTTVTIAGKIVRDLDVNTESLEVSTGSVGGTVTQVKPPAKAAKKEVNGPFLGIGAALAVSLAMFVTAMVLVAIAPRRFHGLADEVLAKPGKTVLVGLLAAVLLPIGFVLLLITVVGIPLALLLGVVWVVAGFISGPIFAYIIGRRLMSKSNKPLAIMAVGSVVVLLLYLIPVVNVFVGITAYLMGIGALVGATGNALGKPKYTV